MKYFFTLLGLLLVTAVCQAQSITSIQQGQPCSIRGLSVVDDKVAWVSGSKGHVALSVDGGTTWKWQQVKGFEQSDFRDIEAFSDREAIIMSSGTPALILKTTDGGTSWKVCYRNNDKAYFLDAMDFIFDGKRGYVMGDPINGKFLLLETTDQGTSWKSAANAPEALPGEAAFAASGTCLKIADDSRIHIVTGGKASRLLSSFIGKPGNGEWLIEQLPIVHGKDSQGAFSIASFDRVFKVAVGGDYQVANRSDSVACNAVLMDDGISGAQLSYNQPAGYQSCVALIKEHTFLSTGTSGTNISTNRGQHWKQVDKGSYNVCQKAKHGNLVLLAGDNGKIAFFKKQ
ncbi:WD40/YVTN/BNR-like repeat-containing protein [Mucilaginibacter lacusdianchii]|uniref:WD40/YVTN/BNR-like repeat-containing protein n=1 Tax=Mucilaginibacter lacusdianchii TaxID=2684211 RepID=UPI00131C7D9F|nr:YCF48-related protein [Mucilaginibacter sp. JXJ CY 39]